MQQLILKKGGSARVDWRPRRVMPCPGAEKIRTKFSSSTDTASPSFVGSGGSVTASIGVPNANVPTQYALQL